MKTKWFTLLALMAVLGACSSVDKSEKRRPSSESYKRQLEHHYWGYDQNRN